MEKLAAECCYSGVSAVSGADNSVLGIQTACGNKGLRTLGQMMCVTLDPWLVIREMASIFLIFLFCFMREK